MESIINDSKATAVRTLTCSPMGSTFHKCSTTGVDLMQDQDDTVLTPCGGGQGATLQVTMHLATAAPAPSRLLHSKIVLESKTTPYMTML